MLWHALGMVRGWSVAVLPGRLHVCVLDLIRRGVATVVQPTDCGAVSCMLGGWDATCSVAVRRFS